MYIVLTFRSHRSHIESQAAVREGGYMTRLIQRISSCPLRSSLDGHFRMDNQRCLQNKLPTFLERHLQLLLLTPVRSTNSTKSFQRLQETMVVWSLISPEINSAPPGVVNHSTIGYGVCNASTTTSTSTFPQQTQVGNLFLTSS